MAYYEGEISSLGGSNANWGDNGAWWIIIFLIFALGGNRGGLFGGSGNGGVTDGYVLTSDFANIERKLDGVNNGLCDGFYAMNTGMLNGFSGLTSAVTNEGYQTRNAVYDVSRQLADCCCMTQRAIDGVNFNNAKNTTDIIQAGHNDTQRIVDLLTAQSIEAKNEKIAEQQAMINALQLKASQEAQNTYLINQLRPCPVPAYLTCNPFAASCGGTTTL